MLATLVSMCAQLLQVDKPTSAIYGVCSTDGPLVQLAYELVSVAMQGMMLNF